MAENSCLLCFQAVNNIDKGSEVDSCYKQTEEIFLCCDRFLCDELKGDSFHWNYSTNNPSPFCPRCFNSSKKLWFIEEKLKEIDKELEDYIVEFSQEIIIARSHFAHSPKDNSDDINPRCSEKCHEIILGIPCDQSSCTEDLESQNENSDVSLEKCLSLVSLTSPIVEDNEEIIIEVFKEEPREHTEDNDNINDIDFSSPVASPLPNSDEPEFNFTLDDHSHNLEVMEPNNEITLKTFSICLERIDSKYIKKADHLNSKISTTRELRVSLERLRFDADGKFIQPIVSRKRKAAIAAAASLSTKQRDDDFVVNRFLRNDRYLKDEDEVSNFSGEDVLNEDSDIDNEKIKSKRPKKLRKRQRYKRFECEVCSLQFNLGKELDFHSEESGHANERRFQCLVCLNKYYRQVDLTFHRKVHNKKAVEPLECDICSQTFELASELEAHSEETGHITERLFKCDKCPEKYFRKSDLSCHMKNHSNSFPEDPESKVPRGKKIKETLTCAVCAEKFEFAKDLDTHCAKSGHVTERRFNCSKCAGKYYRKMDLKYHYRVHFFKSHHCPICNVFLDTIFKSRVHKRLHRSGENQEKPKKPKKPKNPDASNSDTVRRSQRYPAFTCAVCSETFEFARDLDAHGVKTEHVTERLIKCDECPRAFYRKLDLRHHKHTHSYIAKPCPTCNIICNSYHTFHHHLKMHKKRGQTIVIGRKNLRTTVTDKFECIVCSAEFRFARELDEHSEEAGHANGRPFQCSQCPNKYYRQCDLRSHKKSHGNRTKICELCGHVSSNNQNHKIHLEKHHSNATPELGYQFQCSFCEKGYLREKDLNQHNMVTHTGASPFKCKICSAAFSLKTLLAYHVKGHQLNYIQCTVCFEMHRNELSLKYHMKTHEYEARVKCDYCIMSFREKRHLIAHEIAEHAMESPFKCRSCDKIFNYGKDLAFHLKSQHPNDPDNDGYIGVDLKRYSCKLCDKSYNHKKSLSYHLAVAHEQSTLVKRKQLKKRPKQRGIFPCPHCERVFTIKQTLNVHVKVVHLKTMSFVCHFCGKDLSSSTTLRSHLRIHTGETHDCQFCGRGFSEMWNLRIHIKRIHEQNKRPRKAYRRTPASKAKQPTNMNIPASDSE